MDGDLNEHTALPSPGASERALRIPHMQPTSTAQTTDWRVLPPEIWHHVALFACMDGGRTGCSLSAVSKEMSAIAALSRYTTLAFFSPREVFLFVEHLERAGLREIACVAMIIAPRPAPQSTFDEVRRSADRRNLDEPHVVAVLTVLRAAAPTLELLSITWGAVGTTRVLEMVDFPALRDLVWEDGVLRPSAAWRAIPALRRLHVGMFIRPATLAALAPGLVELRISCVPDPYRLLDILVVKPETSTAPRLASLLRRLVICYDESWSWARRNVCEPATPGDPLADHEDALTVMRWVERPAHAWAGEVLFACKPSAVNHQIAVDHHLDGTRLEMVLSDLRYNWISPQIAVLDHRINWTDLLAGGCGPWISRDLPQNHTAEEILLVTVLWKARASSEIV
jgi:hypothetical protein